LQLILKGLKSSFFALKNENISSQ